MTILIHVCFGASPHGRVSWVPFENVIKCLHIDILDPPYQKIDDVSGEEFEKLLKLNVVSYFLVAKVCVCSIFKLVTASSCITASFFKHSMFES